jgi:hypothetical protein
MTTGPARPALDVARMSIVQCSWKATHAGLPLFQHAYNIIRTSICQCKTKQTSHSCKDGDDSETDGKVDAQREIPLQFLDPVPLSRCSTVQSKMEAKNSDPVILHLPVSGPRLFRTQFSVREYPHLLVSERCQCLGSRICHFTSPDYHTCGWGPSTRRDFRLIARVPPEKYCSPTIHRI